MLQVIQTARPSTKKGSGHMVEQVIAGATHLVVGGIAANVLVIFSLLSVAMGGEGSQISRNRRLPSDSDAQLFAILFAVGSISGLIVAFVAGFAADLPYLAATVGVAFVLGLMVTLPRVAKLNEAYLQRAAENLDEGHYKEAFEDASEVARSSERLRARANEIIKIAREMRNRQPLEIHSVG
jgi:hypothetical protein